MKNLTRDQAIEMVNDLLKEDLNNFIEQADNAGEQGDPSFMVSNNQGETLEVLIDWNEQDDLLSYSINEDYNAE